MPKIRNDIIILRQLCEIYIRNPCEENYNVLIGKIKAMIKEHK